MSQDVLFRQIGEIYKGLRVQKGLSAVELCERIDGDIEELELFESGNLRGLQVHKLFDKLFKFFPLSVDVQLFFCVSEPTFRAKVFEDIMDKFRNPPRGSGKVYYLTDRL